jgi:ubiquinol-cytochrome c reductase iron-sulfur subunit
MSHDSIVHDDEGAVPPTLPSDPSRRFWIGTTCAVGGAAGAALAVPFVSTFAPSEKARAAGAPVEVDVSTLAPGEMRTVEWRGKPVWIINRTKEQLGSLKQNDAELADPKSLRPGFTPSYAKNEWRSRKPDLFVAVGICTHLGCSPTPKFTTGPQPSLPNINLRYGRTRLQKQARTGQPRSASIPIPERYPHHYWCRRDQQGLTRPLNHTA